MTHSNVFIFSLVTYSMKYLIVNDKWLLKKVTPIPHSSPKHKAGAFELFYMLSYFGFLTLSN